MPLQTLGETNVQSPAINTTYFQPLPEKDVERLKEDTKLRSSPPVKKIYEVLTETPTQAERQPRSPIQRVAASEVKRSENSEQTQAVKNKLDNAFEFVSKIKVTLRSKKNDLGDPKAEEQKQNDLVEQLEKLKATYPPSAPDTEKEIEITDTRFANILSKLNTEPVQKQEFELPEKIEPASKERIYESRGDSDRTKKYASTSKDRDVSLGDLLESLNKNFSKKDDTHSNEAAEKFSLNASDVVTSGKASVGSFESQDIAVVKKEADAIVQNLISTISQLPITEIRKEPPSLLDTLLDKALQDIEGSRTKIDTISKKVPEDNERMKTLAREENVAAYSPRQAEDIANQIITSSPTKIMSAQYSLTPNAVSQLLF